MLQATVLEQKESIGRLSKEKEEMVGALVELESKLAAAKDEQPATGNEPNELVAKLQATITERQQPEKKEEEDAKKQLDRSNTRISNLETSTENILAAVEKEQKMAL